MTQEGKLNYDSLRNYYYLHLLPTLPVSIKPIHSVKEPIHNCLICLYYTFTKEIDLWRSSVHQETMSSEGGREDSLLSHTPDPGRFPPGGERCACRGRGCG